MTFMDTGFDEQGKRVAVYNPPPTPPELEFISELNDLGADVPVTGAILDAIESSFSVQGDIRAAEAFRRILLLLGDEPWAVALQCVLGASSETVRQASARARISSAKLWRMEKSLRQKLPILKHPNT